MEQLQLTIDELMLDLQNPRFGSVDNQSAALEAIVQLNPQHFRTMMKSIKNNGLDPGDSFYVMAAEEEGDYVVLEGNRRFSAILILNNPSILEGTNLPLAEKKALTADATGFDRSIVEPLRCTLFADRAIANEWIYRRHTGTANGEGRIDWGPLEIQRFEGDRSILDIIDFVRRNGDYEPLQWEATERALKNTSSTLARFLESKAGREHIGLSISKENGETVPYFSSGTQFTLDVLKHLFDDIREGRVDSRKYNKASDIEGYFQQLPAYLQPFSTGPKKLEAFRKANKEGGKNPPEAAVPGANKSQTRTSRAKAPRKTLAPKKHEFKQPATTKGQALVREAGSLNVELYTLSGAFILRAFLEHTIDVYMDANKIPRWQNNKELSLQQRADAVIKHIVAAKLATNQDLRGVTNTITTRSDPASIQSLNDYHHHKYRLPTPEALRTAWESAVPLFTAVYGKA